MAIGTMSLYRLAMRLRLDKPESHREALTQLRRYQTFEMPCFEEVATIEAPLLMGKTKPERKALKKRVRPREQVAGSADNVVAGPWGNAG